MLCVGYWVINNIWQILRANRINANESKLVKQPSVKFELLMQKKERESPCVAVV